MLGRLSVRRKAVLTLGCEPAVIYDILADYGSYVEWMSKVMSSTVIGRETNFAVAELEFAAKPAYKFTLECMHAPPQMVISRSMSGHPLTLKLEWKITSPSPGASKVELMVEGPAKFLAMVGGYATVMNPGATLKALKQQVSTQAPTLPVGEVLIDISEGEDGLVCTYLGKKYKMEAMG